MKIFSEIQNWKDNKYLCEYYDSVLFSDLNPVTQVQAICLNPSGYFVVYKNKCNEYGLPGGHLEKNESAEQALKREIMEEISAVCVFCEPLLYLTVKDLSKPGEVEYHLRYWAIVETLNQPVRDPARNAIERKVVSRSELVKLLNWGKKIDIYLSKLDTVLPNKLIIK